MCEWMSRSINVYKLEWVSLSERMCKIGSGRMSEFVINPVCGWKSGEWVSECAKLKKVH